MSSTDNSTEEHLMFVYGTLKHGQPNNHHIEDQSIGKAEFICSGHTTNKYPLVIAGKYNIPYLLHIPGKGHVSNALRFIPGHGNRKKISSPAGLVTLKSY